MNTSLNESYLSAVRALRFKLVFIGDQFTGKTSIINRFMHDDFNPQVNPTIGIDFVAKTLPFQDKTLRLQLWDTAGQDRFRSLIPSYLKDASTAIIVYDIAERKTFDSLPIWMQFIKDNCPEECQLALVGNKLDLGENRRVLAEEGAEFAKKHGMLFQEVSAKSGENVADLFKIISTELAKTKLHNNTTMASEFQPGAGIKLSDPKPASDNQKTPEPVVQKCTC